MCSALWNKTSSSLSSLYQPPIIGGGFPQLLPSGQRFVELCHPCQTPFHYPSENQFLNKLQVESSAIWQMQRIRQMGSGLPLASLVLVTIFSANSLFLAAATSHH